MCICMCARMYVYVHVCACAILCVCTNMCKCLHESVHARVCMQEFLQKRKHAVYVRVSACACACNFVRVCVKFCVYARLNTCACVLVYTFERACKFVSVKMYVPASETMCECAQPRVSVNAC